MKPSQILRHGACVSEEETIKAALSGSTSKAPGSAGGYLLLDGDDQIADGAVEMPICLRDRRIAADRIGMILRYPSHR